MEAEVDKLKLMLLPLTEEENTVAEHLRAHMLDLWRNGLAKGSSYGEEINSREIYKDVLLALNDYWGRGGWQRKFGWLDSDAFHKREEYKKGRYRINKI